MKYDNQNLFENEKQTQLFQMFLEKYPYLNPNFEIEEIMFTCSSNVNENISNFTKYTQRDVKDEIQNCIFNYVQLHVLNILINQLTRLPISKGMLGSEKTFFNTYFTHIFKCKLKCIINNN